MSESDDSGLVVCGDEIALAQYENKVVLCKNCGHFLTLWRNYVQRDVNWVSFPINVLTLSFDPAYVSWKCNNCKTDLSAGIPNHVVQMNFRSQLCVLATMMTEQRFVMYQMGQDLDDIPEP